MKLPFQFFFKITVFTFFIFMLNSCDISGSQQQNCLTDFVGVPTSAVSGPTTATVNQIINLDVSFTVDNGCGSFQLFNKVSGINPNETIVTVNAQFIGCTCTQEIKTLVQPYAFSATTAGVYVLKFKITNDTFVTHTITVS